MKFSMVTRSKKIMIHVCVLMKTWPLVSCFLMVIFSISEKRVLSIEKKSSKEYCLYSVSDIRIQVQESIVQPVLWLLLWITESNTGDVSNLALKFYILWNMRISLLFLILLLTCFTYIPFLSVSATFICTNTYYCSQMGLECTWIVEKILSLCGSWLLRPNRAKFEHNPVCGSTNAPLVFTKEKQKGFARYHYRLSCLWFFGHCIDMR